MSSNPGTTATGGGTQDAPTPAYNSNALATPLKKNVLTTEQVSTICGSQGIDVNDVCSAAHDQPTPRTRGTPRSALRSAGGSSKRLPGSVGFQGVGFSDDDMMTRPLLSRPH